MRVPRNKDCGAAVLPDVMQECDQVLNIEHKLFSLIYNTSLPKVIWEEGRVAAKVSPHWLQWRAPNLPQKVPLPVDRSPNSTTCLISGPVQPMMPNGIRIRSAVFSQCTGQTDRRTYIRTERPTDHPRESLLTIGRYASNKSDAA